MSKIKDVSRAITEAIALQNVDPFSISKFGGINPPMRWDEVARAAIEAMRELTPEMEAAAARERMIGDGGGRERSNFSDEWDAAIDAALAEG
jgi:hypothetical protein